MKKSDKQFNAIKVFSATMAADREVLGETVTAWIAEHPEHEVVDMVITQSSDEAFHCLAITVFYVDKRPEAVRRAEAERAILERKNKDNHGRGSNGAGNGYSRSYSGSQR